MICKPFDGAAYDCCSVTAACGTSDCCFGDSAGNFYCTTPCTNGSTCGAASCITFTDFSRTICSGTMGCGP
jgi:hypothetical protein